METLNKEQFHELLQIRPQSIIGKRILYYRKQKEADINDVSLGGDYILLEDGERPDCFWVPADSMFINGSVEYPLIEIHDTKSAHKPGEEFTVESLCFHTYRIIGQPSSEQEKPLFKTVEALNKEMLELKFEIENLKKKE